jgi:outer membrane lipopolysaccharide assembly protein LptE/RlpB
MKILLIFLITLTSHCGFEVYNKSQLVNFDIANISSSGNKRINYKIVSKLNSINIKNNENLIELEINSTQNKTIKEKNIKNEITKYELTISVVVQVKSNKNMKKQSFTKVKSGFYNSGEKYSTTLSNEKRLIELLTSSLSNQIFDELIIKVNDL